MPIVSVNQRQAPWIGIGVSGQWDDYKEALDAAQLDFEVRSEKAYWLKPYSPGDVVCYNEEIDIRVNVRNTDDEVLGIVKPQYSIVQNEDAFRLVEPFTQAGGIITNAGMTEQGLCFMVLRMRNKEFLGDAYDFDVMCTNSFNGAFPCALIMVPTRIVCQNMYRKLMGNHDSLLHVKHCSQADDKIKAATAAIGAIDSYISAFGLTLQKANDKALPTPDLIRIVELLFPYPKPGGTRELMSKERVDRMREEFVDRYYDAPDNMKFHGTGMGFINAYYDYLSHRDPGKNMPGSWDHKRLSGLVSGDVVKANLIEKAI